MHLCGWFFRRLTACLPARPPACLQGSQYVIKALADEVATGKYHGFVLNGDISCEWRASCLTADIAQLHASLHVCCWHSLSDFERQQQG